MESLARQAADAATPQILHLLDAPGGRGPWNMAVDEAVARRSTGPALRLYCWPEKAFTFGYAQSASGVGATVGARPATRRLTGGGLVDHGKDVTLTLFVPTGAIGGAGFPSETRASYRFLHSLIREALIEIGLACELCPERPGGPVCFAAPVCDDLVRRPNLDDPMHVEKIVGGAQRRLREGLLHQGSINAPELDPGPEIIARLESAIASRLAVACGWEINRDRPTPATIALAEKLEAERYSQANWNTMR